MGINFSNHIYVCAVFCFSCRSEDAEPTRLMTQRTLTRRPDPDFTVRFTFFSGSVVRVIRLLD